MNNNNKYKKKYGTDSERLNHTRLSIQLLYMLIKIFADWSRGFDTQTAFIDFIFRNIYIVSIAFQEDNKEE